MTEILHDTELRHQYFKVPNAQMRWSNL